MKQGMRGKQIGLIVLALLILGMLFGLLNLQESLRGSVYTGGVTLTFPYTQATSASPEQSAFEACAALVKPYLKAPATAQFPGYEKRFVSQRGTGQYQINAYVDARNALGMIVRVDYWCEAKCVEGGKCVIDEWSLADR